MNNKEKILAILKGNSKVMENYFFMTIIQVFSSLIGIIIFPYVIRKLGAESYGLYIFALSITTYFFKIIGFGFSMPAIKAISLNPSNNEVKSEVVSSVLFGKIILAITTSTIFFILLFTIPYLYQHKWLYIVCYTQIISEIVYSFWYFQAMQKMKIVAIIQFFIRLLSIPVIFILIKNPADNVIYALIGSVTYILVSTISFTYIILVDRIKIKFVEFKILKQYFKDALPFFWSSSVYSIKIEIITTVIGIAFSMKEVAFYDLANKIILLPRMLTASINEALFPKVVLNPKRSIIKNIIKKEVYLGIAVIITVILTGYWIVLILGGSTMLMAYPLSIIISFTLLNNLVIGSYYNFIFTPQNRYYLITKNQIVSFFSFLLIGLFGFWIIPSIFTIMAALVLSGFGEIFYCNYLAKKYKLI